MIFGEIKRFFDIEIVKITEKLEFKDLIKEICN